MNEYHPPYELRVIVEDNDRPFHVVAVSDTRPDRTVATFASERSALLAAHRLNMRSRVAHTIQHKWGRA